MTRTPPKTHPRTSPVPRQISPGPHLTLSTLLIFLGSAVSAAAEERPVSTPDIAVPVLTSDAETLCTDFGQIDGVVVIEGDIALGTCRQSKAGAGTWEFTPRGAFAEQASGLLGPKAAVVPSSWTWPGGVVPYVISNAFSEASDPKTHGHILNAIRHWNAQSIVQLVPRTGQSDYVEFVTSSGCSSFLGRIGGSQPIRLVSGGACGFGGTVHEIGHALGFYHEQSRQDRDSFVTIVWEKIQGGTEHNFEKYTSGSDVNDYDYGSIMHYFETAFSTDGSATIVPNPSALSAYEAVYGDVDIGQRRELSPLDRQAADELYNVCSSAPASGSGNWQANAWRSCSSSCAAPGRTREVFCHAANGACTGDGACSAPKPPTQDSCTAILDCDFDTDNCGWDSVDPDDDFNWLPSYGSTPSSGTGPSSDHTSGSGHYLYTEMSSPRQAGDVANLTSVPFDIPSGVTLKFWYHYFGTSLPTLEVQIVSCGGSEQTLLTISPNNTSSQDAWRQASVQLPVSSASRIRFKVTRNSSWSGDVAIDDIELQGYEGSSGPSEVSDMVFTDDFESGDLSKW